MVSEKDQQPIRHQKTFQVRGRASGEVRKKDEGDRIRVASWLTPHLFLGGSDNGASLGNIRIVFH